MVVDIKILLYVLLVLYIEFIYSFSYKSLFSVLLCTTQCPNQLKAIIKSLGGLEEIIAVLYALHYTRRRISVGLYACYETGKVARAKALKQPWLKLIKCGNTVNSRFVSDPFYFYFLLIP